MLLAGVWTASRWGLVGVAAAVGAARLVLHALLAHLTLGLLGIGAGTLLRRCMPALWTGSWAAAALWLAAGEGAGRGGGRAAAALAFELAVWGVAATAATYLAPPFARPYFPHWGLAQLPFDAMGLPGRWARKALLHLARRWPAPPLACRSRRQGRTPVTAAATDARGADTAPEAALSRRASRRRARARGARPQAAPAPARRAIPWTACRKSCDWRSSPPWACCC